MVIYIRSALTELKNKFNRSAASSDIAINRKVTTDGFIGSDRSSFCHYAPISVFNATVLHQSLKLTSIASMQLKATQVTHATKHNPISSIQYAPFLQVNYKCGKCERGFRFMTQLKDHIANYKLQVLNCRFMTQLKDHMASKQGCLPPGAGSACQEAKTKTISCGKAHS